MKVTPMNFLHSPDWQKKNYLNRTTFNETGFQSWKLILCPISLIIVQIMSGLLLFSSGNYKKSIGNTFIITYQKYEHFIWPSVLLLSAVNGRFFFF